MDYSPIPFAKLVRCIHNFRRNLLTDPQKEGNKYNLYKLDRYFADVELQRYHNMMTRTVLE